MIFRFFGAAQEVGRSSIIMRDEGSTLMFDCGIKLAERPEYPIELPEIDALILSHAHIDHCGAVPTIYNEMSVPAFGTRPTVELSELLLNDSLQVARKEHFQARFRKREIKSFLNKYVPLEYKRTANFSNFDITMYDAGHIIGSAITLIDRKKAQTNKRIVYTGDYKVQEQMMHKGAEIIKSDVLITESTYGMREHPDRQTLIKEIVEKIKTILQNGGNVLMPVFAVGRSQEILAILQKNNLIEHVYVDGMARKATHIALKYREFMNNYEALKTAADEALFVEELYDREEALSKPSIIVTTAGMLNGGPAMDYITKLRKNSEILLTGYQVEGTNGHMLINRGYVRDGEKEIKINSKVNYYDLSAHAGKDDLFNYVKTSSPHTVICVHGDHQASTSMAESLKLEGYDAYAPKLGETIKIE